NFQDVYRDPVLLVDTYDTLNGVREAAKIPRLKGIRLDSGDLDTLSRESRKILDDASRRDVKIVVSNDLNEYKIDALANAPIDIFAVGTELALSPDAPSLGIVYKVVYDEDCDRPLVKVSPGKTTLPGRKQVFLDTRDGGWSHLIALEGAVQPTPQLTPLMDCHIKDGVPTNDGVSLNLARTYCNSCLVNLHDNLAGLDEGTGMAPVVPHDSLKELFEKAVK
ncbi:MAG: nicotinate phosphoribosyltransferase, partial [bacterium]